VHDYNEREQLIDKTKVTKVGIDHCSCMCAFDWYRNQWP